VGHFINRERATRATKAVRLAALGWTQEEIGEVLGVDQRTISLDTKNCESAKIGKSLGKTWNDKDVADYATRMMLPLTDAMAAAMVGRSRKSLTG
jgi:DNA-binding XRE family transcriptional regulator